MLATKNPYIESAYEQLQVISQDKEKRLEYEAREKAMRDHNQLIFEAKQEGKQEEKQIIAQKMLALGVPIDTIAECTGLSEDEIKQIL